MRLSRIETGSVRDVCAVDGHQPCRLGKIQREKVLLVIEAEVSHVDMIEWSHKQKLTDEAHVCPQALTREIFKYDRVVDEGHDMNSNV